ncbi:MAG: Gfo/Idh/MocA family oxidoreductase, partial [Methanosarcinales archaeon]
DGVAYLDYINQTLELYNDKGMLKPNIEYKEPLRQELEHFIEVVYKDKQPLVTGEDGIHALQVAICAIESYKYGRNIEVKL